MQTTREQSTECLVDAALARRVFLERQGLLAPPGRKLRAADVQAIVERLGFVQVDSINTVERAHHMILFARNQTYRPALLATLLERERSLFENWTHDASIIPSQFYPLWRRKFVRNADRLRQRLGEWQQNGFETQLEQTLAHVAANGPVKARELAPERKGNGGGWWNWHPSKTALEYLWRTGELAIAYRDGFEKAYDLSERVIPAEHQQEPVEEAAFVDRLCRGALARLGFATPAELAGFWGLVTLEEARAWSEAVAGRDYPLVHVGAVDGSKPRLALAEPEVLDRRADEISVPPRLRVLSPFDPVIRDRRRAMRLFGFDYRIEVFTPAPKRQYGYYVFPLLEGDRFVGRIDMKRSGPSGDLAVRRVWWEPGVRPSKGRLARLEAELDRVRRFAGCNGVVFDDGALR